MSIISIISVGKLKAPHWQKAADDYITRLKRMWQIRKVDLRDGSPQAAPIQRSQEEGERILAAIEPGMIVIAMDERGKTYDSITFAGFLDECMQNKARQPAFVIGGAYGLSDAARARADFLLSLGPMTLPHELAQVVLLEQIYRANTIIGGQPYHHG